MASSDRVQGISGSLAIKAPVRAATTANITLSGLQTIDDVVLAADDRVLVKDQTDTTENGIYVASTGSWQRAKDFDGAYDSVAGTLITVNEGTANAEALYRVAVDGTPGTDALTFSVSASTGLTANLASTAAGLGSALVGIEDAGAHFAGGTVEAALQELGAEQDVQNSNIGNNSAAINANASALTAHLNDTTDAHDASAISVVDAGGYFAGTDAEAAMQELGAAVAQALGVGQTWQTFPNGANPTTERQVSTIYTNSTGRAIVVSFRGTGTAGTSVFEVFVAGTSVFLATTGPSAKAEVAAVVPPGATYQVTISSGSFDSWRELR